MLAQPLLWNLTTHINSILTSAYLKQSIILSDGQTILQNATIMTCNISISYAPLLDHATIWAWLASDFDTHFFNSDFKHNATNPNLIAMSR
jgi:hypothetical protein